jgi:hypothetical protein
LGDIASARVALRERPAVRDCNVIGMRAGDRSGVASSAGELAVGAAGPVAGAVEAGEMPLEAGAVEAGAVEAGAVATGNITTRPASAAAREARRTRETELEEERTRARYAGA